VVLAPARPDDEPAADAQHRKVLLPGFRPVLLLHEACLELADGAQAECLKVAKLLARPLDPGMAFGTGLHPTTRLCLAGLEDWAGQSLLDGVRVLDVGCGSGILGIAAALLGAGEVFAIDTDPIAVEATRANAALNGLGDRLVARHGSLPATGEPYPLVVANLIASLLVDLAPTLAEAVEPGGRLLASGIFVDRESEVVAALSSVRFEVVRRWADGDWVALDLAGKESGA
jgi:ribosomal protein L11 methyltransferase